MRISLVVPCTLMLVVTVTLAATTSNAVPPTPTFSAGKHLVAKYKCNTCHGADLKGKPGKTPSLRVSGITGHYNIVSWQTVLNTGDTKKGGKVTPPMPVYHMSAKDATDIYAYLYSLPK